MTQQRFDVAVIGGGLIGCTVAHRLAVEKHSVVLLERDEPGSGASGAAAGMLAPLVESEAGSPLLEAGRRSLRLYPRWVDEIRATSGIDPHYRRSGLVMVALDAAEIRFLEERLAWQQSRDFAVQWLSRPQLEAELTGLSIDIISGLLYPDQGVVDPVLLTRAVATAAAAAGAEVRTGSPVSELVMEAGRVCGVLCGETRVRADLTVVAAGCWTSMLTGALSPIPDSEPVRGQMVALKPEVLPGGRVLVSSAGYLVPQGGTLLAGATMERVGYRPYPDPTGVDGLLAMAKRLIPWLDEAPVVGAWAGLRPGSPDGLPTIDHCGLDGLMVATGHLRNGILLAPVTAELVADLVAGRSPAIGPGPFRRSRPVPAAPPPAG